MDSNYNHIAFLCGYFKREKAIEVGTLKAAGWNRVDYTSEQQNRGKRYYYPEFIDFCYAQSEDEGCKRYTREVNTEVSMMIDVRGESKKYSFWVKDLTLYFMPHQMVLYSIKVEQGDASIDDCSALIYKLRYIDGFKTDVYKDFCAVAVQPIIDVYNALKANELRGVTVQDATMLVEYGNKLRVFQVINAPAGAFNGLNDEEKRHLLYGAATFSTVSIEGQRAIDDTPEKWQRRNRMCRIAVFDSWSALAMQDSFNILASGCDNQMENWIDKYFGCIYIQALFQKVCLFDFNNRFKQALKLQKNRAASKQINNLVREYEAFERNCCFNWISYNFLPQLVSDAVNSSLEIKDEMKQLYRIMANERARSEEASRKKMNALLVGISFLTLFSAIWDACSLVNEMVSFPSHFSSSFQGFRIVGLVMAVFVLVVLVFLYGHKRDD